MAPLKWNNGVKNHTFLSATGMIPDEVDRGLWD
jgi:hypothetical protein